MDQPITYGDYFMFAIAAPVALSFVVFLWREIFS